MSLLAINWEPEIRGLLTVIIAVTILCGSIYLILSTNLGGRLGFLVLLTALFGWLMLMGITWLTYGIGLRGKDPTWQAVPGRTVLQDKEALYSAGILDAPAPVPDGATGAEAAAVVADQLAAQGYGVIDGSSPEFGQVQAAASVFLEETEAFKAGQFQITEVFDIGGDRYPKINDSLDFLAFFHEPHFVLAEAAPFVPVRTEPGRAPVTPKVDEQAARQYVYMVRDRGTRRQPAQVLTVGAGAIFLSLCYLLRRRERNVRANVEAAAAPRARAPATIEEKESVSV